MHYVFLRYEGFPGDFSDRLSLNFLFLRFISWGLYLLSDQKVSPLLVVLGLLDRFWLGVLVGDFIVDDLN
jgi:hypothetical protein